MKSRLNNINLIKKIMIGLMLICFCVVGINTYNIDTVYAKDPQLKTKTFWVNSNQPVTIAFLQNNDKKNETQPGWHQGGTINCYSETSTKSGYAYQYKIVMDKVDVTHYTPYIVVTADRSGVYRPNGTLDISSASDYQYGQDGMSRGGNQVHNLKTYYNNDEMQVYIGLGFNKSRLAVNFATMYDYNWHMSFDSNGGTECKSISGKYGTAATLPTSTRNGYTFNGWSGSIGNNLKGTTSNITWTGWNDYYITMTAQWTPNDYYATFTAPKPATANSGISVSGSMDKQKFTYDAENQHLNSNQFSLTGYKFVQWHRKDNESRKIQDNGDIYNENNGKDFTLVAEWTPKIFDITANNQGGEGGFGTIYEKYDTGYYMTSNCTTKATKLVTPTRIGYEFKGYYTGQNGKGTKLINADGSVNDNSTTNHLFASSSVVYANWEPCKYTVTLNKNGGTNGTDTIVEKYNTNFYTDKTCTTVCSYITVPTRANYIFKGYSTEKNNPVENNSLAKGNTIITSDGKITCGNTDFTADTTLYAIWVPKDYKVGLNADTISGVEVPSKGTKEYFEKYSLYNYVNQPEAIASASNTMSYSFGNYTGQWKSFTAPYDGEYTFTSNGKSTTYHLKENETIKVYVR